MYKMSYSVALVWLVSMSCMHGAAGPAGYDTGANYFLGFYLPALNPGSQEVLNLVNEVASVAQKNNLIVKYKPRLGQSHITVKFIGKIDKNNYDKLIENFKDGFLPDSGTIFLIFDKINLFKTKNGANIVLSCQYNQDLVDLNQIADQKVSSILNPSGPALSFRPHILLATVEGDANKIAQLENDIATIPFNEIGLVYDNADGIELGGGKPPYRKFPIRKMN